MIDEGPSSEDIERFGGDTDECPECGAEVYDQAEMCHACGAYVTVRGRVKGSAGRGMQARWIILIALLALAGFVITFVL